MKKQILSCLSVITLSTALLSCNECKDCVIKGGQQIEKKCGEDLKKAEADSFQTCD
jgi:hypothetical protein